MKTRINQQGLSLLLLVFLMAIIITGYIVKNLDSVEIVTQRDKNTAIVLAEAKAALIGFALNENISSAGYLPNPDLKLSSSIPEGSQSGMAGTVDISLLGKLPWYSLGMPVMRDGWNECLWYAVSGRFKSNPATTVLNWDTLGQIDVIDANGNPLISNLAALIFSPNAILSGQSRALASVDYKQCGGNYDARNYLDSFSLANAVSGKVNYFQGGAINGAAPSTTNKTFVLAKNDYYNDSFIFLTVDEIFRPLIKRRDFALQINELLNDVNFKSHLKGVVIAGNKGTVNLNCNTISDINNKTFCQNWSEMLLLTELPTPAPIFIDGLATPICTRVLIFGGQKAVLQSRALTDKNNVENYLEGTNATEFAVPIANDINFSGVSTFNSTNSSADVMRCL